MSKENFVVDIQPSCITFNPDGYKCVMKITRDGIWVDPEVEPIQTASQVIQVMDSYIKSLVKNEQDEIQRLKQICRDAYEVYAGSEGFPSPTTASEAYLYQQLHLMKDEIAKGLK